MFYKGLLLEGFVLAFLLSQCSCASFDPGDHVMPGSAVETTDGTFTIPANTLIINYDPSDEFSGYMWRDILSLSAILRFPSKNISYLVLSQSGNGREQALYLQSQYRKIIQTSTNDNIPRIHFGVQSLEELDGWLPNVLTDWPSSRKHVTVFVHGSSLKTASRIDAFYGWIPWPMTGIEGDLVYAGTADVKGETPFIVQADEKSVSKSVALVLLEKLPTSSNHHGRRRYGDIIRVLQDAGAAACLFAAPEGYDVEQVNCSTDEECKLSVNIPVSMVSSTMGIVLKKLLQSGGHVHVNFTETQSTGYMFGVNERYQLVETGWWKFPSLKHVLWSAQWQKYLSALEMRADKLAQVAIEVFASEIMEGEHGVSKTVKMPRNLALFSTVFVDMELNCDGPRDQYCPAWDHMIQLFACCKEDQSQCEVCPTTIWSPQNDDNMNEQSQRCGMEIARWATPFRRRGGRWLTDISSLFPAVLSDARQCTFTMQSTPWAGRWVPSLRLLFSNGNDKELSVGASINDKNLRLTLDRGYYYHKEITTLPYTGTFAFDITYNQVLGKPYEFDVSSSDILVKAEIVSYITGHGSDESNCAEFCVTSHHMEVNGKEYMIEYSNAGTMWGCSENVSNGVLPNEHGTWNYGRNGWCDGQAVQPWVVDITDELYFADDETSKNVLKYTAKQNGNDKYDPVQPPGDIMISSYLIFTIKSSTSVADS